MGIRISKDHLHPSVIESITSLIGDLNQLETTAKGNAVEAINELLANGGKELETLIAEIAEGKELIASAIGEPLNAGDTFSDMCDKIDDICEILSNTLETKGVEVTGDEKLAELIEKINNITVDSMGGCYIVPGTTMTLYDQSTIYASDMVSLGSSFIISDKWKYTVPYNGVYRVTGIVSHSTSGTNGTVACSGKAVVYDENGNLVNESEVTNITTNGLINVVCNVFIRKGQTVMMALIGVNGNYRGMNVKCDLSGTGEY